MDAGTLIWILLIGGGIVGMLFMHRGGHAHGGHGGGGGGGGGCGGHRHGDTSAGEGKEPREGVKTALAKPGSDGHAHEPAGQGDKHRGC